MNTKKKKLAPIPTYSERWKEIAKDGSRLSEAAIVYLEETKTTSLSAAFTAVKVFNHKFMAVHGAGAAVFKAPRKQPWQR